MSGQTPRGRVGPPCARCGGETSVRTQFPDTFTCTTGKRQKTCGHWWGRRDGSEVFWQPTITTIRGYLHWPHGPGHYNGTFNRALCIVRPKDRGWPNYETVYDMASIYLPSFDEPDSMYSQRTKDRALALVAALRSEGRCA